MKFSRLAWIVFALVLMAILAYRIPWLNTRLSWRMLAAQSYIAGILDPIEELPAPQIAITPSIGEPSLVPTLSGPSPTAQPSPTPLPKSARLAAPAYELQGPNNCGPATLSLYLKYYGWAGDQYTVSEEIKPVSADRNVNIDELVYYAQNWAGWLHSRFWVGGDIQLIKTLLANGIPVMVEEGYLLESVYWPNDDQWAGHYLLVTGYDDQTQSFTVQDTFEGGPNRQISYELLDEGWQQFNRVFLLLYLPNQEELIQNILGEQWDEEINRQSALEIALQESQLSPNNPYTWFNLGMNLVYFERYREAADAFDKAREIGLPQRMLRYQFGPFFAYYNANRMEDLDLLVDYALRITNVSEEAQIWKGWSEYRNGNTIAAIEEFRLAYDFNPKSIYVAQALNFFDASP